MAVNVRWAGYLPGDLVQVVTAAELDFCRYAKPKTAEILTGLLTPDIQRLLGQHGRIISILCAEQTQYVLDIAPDTKIDERLIRMYQPEGES